MTIAFLLLAGVASNALALLFAAAVGKSLSEKKPEDAKAALLISALCLIVSLPLIYLAGAS